MKVRIFLPLIFAALFLISCSEESLTLNSSNNSNNPTLTTNDNEVFEELDNLSSEVKTSNLPARRGFEMIEFKGKYWFMGGEDPKITRNTIYYNDIWNSTDGENWTKISDNSPWQERADFNLFTFNNKLWIVGGFNKHNSQTDWLNDVWNSDDGVTWNQVTNRGPWQNREGMSVNVHNNKLYLIGGHSTTNWHIYQDIWESADGKNWQQVGSISDNLLGVNQAREGIYQHNIIKLKDEYYLFAGQIASIFTALTRVLKSKDMVNWEVVNDDVPWKKFKYSGFQNLRPFVYKGNLIMVAYKAIEISGNSPNPLDNIVPPAQFIFNSKDSGVSWQQAYELHNLPAQNTNVKAFIDNPRSLIINGKAFLYGSLRSNYFPTMRYFEIKNN